MPTLLHIDSSPMGGDSLSRELTREFVRRWCVSHPDGVVVHRDLSLTQIPVVDAEWIAANLTPAHARSPRQNEVLAFSTRLVKELLSADECVIGVPMHNWGPAAGFKLWVDQIVRFGETVAITPSGPAGILGNRRVTILVVAGRRYGAGSRDAHRNHLEPWLRTFFEYLGVEDLHIVMADGAADVRYGNLARSAFLARYEAQIAQLASTSLRQSVW